jgi:hypothetical protein
MYTEVAIDENASVVRRIIPKKMENFHRRETHALKDSAMVGTNALAPNADIAKVQ